MQLSMVFCPRCSTDLMRNGATVACNGCGAIYPTRHDIIDLLHALPVSDRQAAICSKFDGLAATYDDTIVSLVEAKGCPWHSYTEELESFMRGREQELILDVGCGTSFPIGSFLPADAAYVGLDSSLHMLERARDFLGDNPRVSLFRMDIERMQMPSDSFDTCLALLSLGVMLDPERAAEKIARALKPGGQLFATVPLSDFGAAESAFGGRPLDEEDVRELLSVFRAEGRRIVSSRHGDILFVQLSR